jgi:hypothetical protein
MGYARIAAIGLAYRPAHQLDTGVSRRFADSEYFFKRLVWENGAYETELHNLRFYCS